MLVDLPRRVVALLSLLLTAGALAAQALSPDHVDDFAGHPRLIVISDIGNEPDDQMSMVRLLLYTIEIDLEALIAGTSTWQKTAIHPETMHTLVAAYAKVQPNLLKHAAGWPAAEKLDALIFPGQTGYGMESTGAGKSSQGSDAIIRAAEKEDVRPLWIALWGGANTLAQALITAQSNRTPGEFAKLVSKLRVYSISDQDDAGPWIRLHYPNLFYIVQPSAPNGQDYYYATWTGISGDAYYRNGEGADPTRVTNEWLDKNVRAKGPLGAAYPRFMFIMEGDTPSWLNLIDNGLNGYRRPDWGGWGGRYVFRQPYGESHPIWTQGGDLFTRVTSQDTVVGRDRKPHTSDQATIWRWREAYQNDFAARMSWTIEDFAHANHPPIAIVNSLDGTAPIYLDATVGRPLILDGSKSHDPDHQSLAYHWFQYQEAGSASGNIATLQIQQEDSAVANVTPTSACHTMWLPGLVPCTGDGAAHIILAVTDDGSPRLTSYRRIVVTVHP